MDLSPNQMSLLTTMHLELEPRLPCWQTLRLPAYDAASLGRGPLPVRWVRRVFLLPKREENAETSTASLRLFAFELRMQIPELFRASRAVQDGVDKSRSAQQVGSYLLKARRR